MIFGAKVQSALFPLRHISPVGTLRTSSAVVDDGWSRYVSADFSVARMRIGESRKIEAEAWTSIEGKTGMRENRFTPLHIRLMLHYRCIAAPYAMHDPAHAGSPAVREFRCQLLELGLLVVANDEVGFGVTLEGERWCDRLCQLAGWIA